MNIIDWLNGKKTYITAASIVVCGVLTACHVTIPEYVWAALAALGLTWLRVGVQKAEDAGGTSGTK